MIPQKSGLSMSSIAGQVALPQLLAYCAAKGAVDQITRVLAGMGTAPNPGEFDRPDTSNPI
jgi:NAD(P)-dependent dehydrogenase (short-subunit alcohol dehydrogenase family)